MTRELSPQALEYLTLREGGMRLDVHDDGYGFPTVGVGHLVLDRDNLKIGDTITKARGVALLQGDLLWARETVRRNVRKPLYQHEFDALVIFAFNLGETNFRSSSLVRRLHEEEDKCQVIKEEMPRWRKSGGVVSRGLVHRRWDTAEMFCKADYTVDWKAGEF